MLFMILFILFIFIVHNVWIDCGRGYFNYEYIGLRWRNDYIEDLLEEGYDDDNGM
jgi:hypothetical protein